MTIDSTALINEISLIAGKQKRPGYTMNAEIYFDTTVVNVIRVANLLRYNDYVGAYAEEWTVDLVLSLIHI